VVRYSTRLADSVCKVRSACPEADITVQQELLKKTCALLRRANDALAVLEKSVENSNGVECLREMANYCHDVIAPAMRALRQPIDQLELIVDKDIWPVPTYGDLMFEV